MFRSSYQRPLKNSSQNHSSDNKISKELVIYYEDPLNKGG